jgi:hypothetical protein
MRFRKLRIAWSVFWGLACVLVILLWVRSHSWRDLCIVRLPGQVHYGVSSYCGNLLMGEVEEWSSLHFWTHHCHRIRTNDKRAWPLYPELYFDGWGNINCVRVPF